MKKLYIILLFAIGLSFGKNLFSMQRGFPLRSVVNRTEDSTVKYQDLTRVQTNEERRNGICRRKLGTLFDKINTMIEFLSPQQQNEFYKQLKELVLEYEPKSGSSFLIKLFAVIGAASTIGISGYLLVAALS